jgi:transcription initiation factor TFIID TATA-box-binding protein
VACCDVGFNIKLEILKEEHEKIARCEYNPEVFPGLIYWMEKPKVALLIFNSGKIVLAGAKCREDVYTAYQKIFPVLFSFRKSIAAVRQLEVEKMK